MLGIATDNALNNNTMFSCFVDLCSKDEIKFDLPNQWVQCLGHIINLAAQLILKNLKAEGLTEEDALLEDNESKSVISLGMVRKVNCS